MRSFKMVEAAELETFLREYGTKPTGEIIS
jgi:hypothetical protein